MAIEKEADSVCSALAVLKMFLETFRKPVVNAGKCEFEKWL